MADHPLTLAVTVEGDHYGGNDVYLAGQLIGHRPYDGSDPSEIQDEVAGALAGLLRERFGWAESAPEDEENV